MKHLGRILKNLRQLIDLFIGNILGGNSLKMQSKEAVDRTAESYNSLKFHRFRRFSKRFLEGLAQHQTMPRGHQSILFSYLEVKLFSCNMGSDKPLIPSV